MNTCPTRVSCLELLPVAWQASPGETHCECASLIEISTIDGVFHVEEPAPAGTAIRISLPRGEIVARVQACIPEGHYGYLLQVEVGRRQEWFGGRYTPSYILCDHPVKLAEAS